MLLFRDEEHVERWARTGGHPKGGLLTLEQLWDLARIWYENRLQPDWRRRTADEATGLLGHLRASLQVHPPVVDASPIQNLLGPDAIAAPVGAVDHDRLVHTSMLSLLGRIRQPPWAGPTSYGTLTASHG